MASGVPNTAVPDRTKPALDAVERNDQRRFPYTLLDFIQKQELQLPLADRWLVDEVRS